MSEGTRSGHRPATRTFVVLAALLAIGVVVGAVWDWFNWHPMSALVATIGAIMAVLVAAVLYVIRRPVARRLAIGLATLALGVILGQVAGPGRPQLIVGEGTGVVTLTAPRAASGDAVGVSCQRDAAGTELQMTIDQNTRVDIVADDPNLPTDIDQREFFGLTLTVGDRWFRRSGANRGDETGVFAIVGRVEADQPEVHLIATDASRLDLSWTAAGGTLAFGDLVQVMDTDATLGPDPFGLTGTITWTC